MNAKAIAPKRGSRRVQPSHPGVVKGPLASEGSDRGTELPHERDENPGSRRRDEQDPNVEQAYRDVKSGQSDTDLRGTATKVFERAGNPGRTPPRKARGR